MSTMKTTRDVKGVGVSIPRPDGPEKVTGRVQYVADIQLPRACCTPSCCAARTPTPGSSRSTRARPRRCPACARCSPRRTSRTSRRRRPTRAHAMLAIDRVVFVGQPVAAVAADELSIAEEALDLIEVEYEVLPASIDPLKSMQPGAPPVADAGTEADTSEALAHSAVAIAKSETPAKAVNIAQQARLQRGDRGQGLRRVRSRPREDLPRADGAPGLSRGARGPGRVGPQRAAHALGQHPGLVQHAAPRSPTCSASPRTASRSSRWSAAAASAARSARSASRSPRCSRRSTKRPVRYVMTRREELQAGMPAPQVIIKLKTGVKHDGTLMALDGGDRHRLRRLLRRGADDERGVPRQRLQVAVLRRPRLRGADPQAEHRRLSRADGAADHLRDRLAHGADRPRSRARPGRVPAAPPDRSAGDPMANGQPWQSNGARAVLEPLAEHPLWKSRDGVGRQRRARTASAARHRPGRRRLARRAPADRAPPCA